VLGGGAGEAERVKRGRREKMEREREMWEEMRREHES